jgi:SAM-dependent methyltransferase
MLNNDDIKFLNKIIVNKKISSKTTSEIAKRLDAGDLSDEQYFLELILSAEFLSTCRKNAIDYHLYFIHHARLKLVATLLPKAGIILDLGGANGSIYDMGYPYKFDQIVVVDLPPENRTEMYKDLSLRSKVTPNGPIDIHFGDMSDLSFVSDNSVDLVWSGESIEHISEEAGTKMIDEAFRVLKPGGYFCLDTPNRLMTEIHTKDADVEFIHPEHKIEYYPKKLQKKLKKAGFKIRDKRGICEMRNTSKSKEIDYTDFILGNPLPYDIDTSYMQYYACQKRK